ncbi:MAG: CHAT domain-containing protein [Chloroflexota bacterium]|nr:CHAT domain-containing protein [Chloroflexota bacterium]
MSGPSAVAVAQRLLDGNRADVQTDDVLAVAELLKVEADRQLNIDSQRALSIADLICALAEDGRVRALGLLTRADALRKLGRYAEATQTYQASADLFVAAGDAVGWARTRSGAAATARSTGAYGQVLTELVEARRIFAERGLFLRLARVEGNTGVLLAALGRTEEALAAYQRGLEAAERVEPHDDVIVAESLANLAIAYYQVDDHEQAEVLYGRALAIFEHEGQHENIARAQRNYARFAAGRGQYSKALSAVLPGRRSLLSMGRTDAAAHLGQVGVDCLVRLNRDAEAAELGLVVAREFESSGARVEAAVTHGLRSVALARIGESEAALAALDQAQSLFGTAEWDSGLATVRLGRAVVLGETGQWPLALEEAVAIRDELQRHGLIARAAEADLVRTRALRALGQHTAATAAARSALDLVRDRALPWLSYHAWRLLGELARDTGDADAALAALLQAIANLEHVQGRILTEYRTSFLADKSDVYEAVVSLLLERGDVERAFELVERAKSRALIDALAGGLDIRVRAHTAEQRRLVEELTQRRREHDDRVERAESGRAVLDLERRIGVILEELRLAGADDLERLSLLEARVYSPREQLQTGTALVEYYTIGSDLLVFVMTHASLRAQRIPDALPRVARLQRGLKLNLDAATRAPDLRASLEPNARVLLQRLYTVLVHPVADQLANCERLIVVPHGPLHQIPFAALHDGLAYLVERFEVVLAPSASSLTFCLRPRAREGERAMVVAHSSDGTLPGAIAEAKAIARIYQTESLLEERATVARLREGARDADLIHLATHGVSRVDAPLFSYLRLADGHLSALDCFDLELDCALVTLSACESGRGVVDAGDEQIGLPRAFLYAGARAVLHSLWRIDDRATQTLMEHFYIELRAGRGRAASLRAAQLASLRQSGSAHPFLWAALVLVGDWR